MNIDLTKILKNCPEGFELYTPLLGKVSFLSINKDTDFPIMVKSNLFGIISFTKEGYYIKYTPDGECLLFPSKEQRDWSKFIAPWYKREKFDPKTLKVFDKVLVKVSNTTWRVSLFSHCDYNYMYPYVCVDGAHKYCIPYNDDTKHLVGTEDRAPEYYRYWDD